MEAGEHVGREPGVGQNAPDGRHAVEIPLAGILAVHRLKYRVRSALHRQVDVSRQVLMRGDDLERAVAHVLWVRGREADAHVGGRLGHHAEQRGEVDRHARLLVVIHIAVDVLAEQGRLLKATGAQVGQLAQYALRLARTFAAPRVGHDAVGTEIIATPHDGYEASHGPRASQAPGHDVAVGLRRREVDVYGRLPGLGRRHQIREVEIGIRTRHEVHAMLLDELVTQTLGHAADHSDYHVAPRLAAQGVPI